MRRSVPVLALAALLPALGLGLTAPAYADTTVEVKGIQQQFIKSVEGPAGVPTGIGSLKMYHRASAESTRYPTWLSPSLRIDALATLSITYRAEVPVSVEQLVEYNLTPTQDPRSDMSTDLRLTLPATSSWTTVDLLARPWSDSGGRPRAWSTFPPEFPGGTLVRLSLVLKSTHSTGAAWIDALRYGPSGDTTTISFDTDPVPVLHASTAPVTIASGASTPLSGRVTHADGTPFSGLPMALWKQSFGNPTHYKVLTTPTAADGSFRAVVSPAVKTSYFWQVDDGTNRYYATPWRTVFVAPALTLRVADPTVPLPTASVFAGSASPVLVGRTVTLRRATDHLALGHAVVAGDGTFRLSRTLPRGTYYVVVTSPAQGGLSAGRSAPLHVAIR